MTSLFGELKRRNVIRVGAAYLVAAWVLLQIGDVMFEMMEIPDWAGKLLVTILALGFPLTLVFAWAFELTPEGLKSESEIDRSEAVKNVTAKKLDIITIVMVVAALGLLAADRLLVSPQVPANSEISTSVPEPTDASVAVLPFENISQEAANEPFTIGIHDDLITQISKIGSLRTISRTSVLRYRERIKTVPEIAAELGVATVLEGGVQRVGDTVRINVRLTDAKSNAQLWGEAYDRNLTAANIFAIQSEIVTAIAEALQTTLSPDEQKSIDTVPTQKLEALEAYFLGRQSFAERNTTSLQEAVDHFERAIAFDSEFALAYVGLSDSLQLQEDVGSLPRAQMIAKAEPAIIKALALNAELGEAYTSYGGIRITQGDIASAETMYQRGIALSPNHSTTYLWYGWLLIDTGRIDEAATLIRKGIERDPLSAQLIEALGATLEFQGRFDAALNQYRRIINFQSNFASTYLAAGKIYWTALGRPDRGIACQRKSIELDPGSRLAQTWQGLLYLDLGAIDEAEQWLDGSLALGPDSQEPHVALALLEARRGEQSESVRYAAEAYDKVPWYPEQRLFQSIALALLRNNDLRDGKAADARAWYEDTYPELLAESVPEIDAKNFRPAIDVAYVLLQTGDEDRANLLLDLSLSFLDSGTIARVGTGGYGIADVQIYALRGEALRALASLRDAIDLGWRAFWWFYLKYDPNLESLHSNADYQAMVREMESLMAIAESTSVDADSCNGLSNIQ